MLIKKIIIKSVVQTINFLNFKPILNQNNMKNLTTFTKKANWLKTFNFFEHKTINNCLTIVCSCLTIVCS